MSTNLAPDYVQFVDNQGRIDHLVQELIDRAQYHPGFLDLVELLLKEYESPFEWVDVEGEGRIRKLKSHFVKSDNPETKSLDPDCEGCQCWHEQCVVTGVCDGSCKK